MVQIVDIVDVEVKVSTSAISRQGFNSLLILGKATSFGAGWTTSGAYQVKEYTSLTQALADTDIVTDSPVQKMLTAAFAQSPRVPKVYVANGTGANVAAPSADLTQIAKLNNSWFGLVMEHDAVAAIDDVFPWVAANKKYGFFRLAAKNAFPTATSNWSSVWYSSTSPVDYIDVAAASTILARTPGSYTAAFKELEGVQATTGLTVAEETTFRSKGVNWYPEVGGRKITYNGTVYNGSTSGFIDTYIGALYLEARMEEDVFAVLVAAEKVPYTDDGINIIVNTIYGRLGTSVAEGYLAPDPAPVVDAPKARNVPATDKAARLLQNVTFVAYTAGAIQRVMIKGTVVV
jgi:hypothetical protein